MKWLVSMLLSLKDREGNIIINKEFELDTFVKNFLLLLNAAFSFEKKSVVDTGGTPRDAWAGYADWNNALGTKKGCCGGWSPIAPANDGAYGIVVGTSDTPVSVDDYNLGAKIAHGSGAGQLIHAATTLPDLTVDGNKVIQSILRSFHNNSGAGIEVKEIGLIVKTGLDYFLVMIIRDVITPANVPVAGALDVTIKITTTA